jgi:HNH endonuclease
LSEQAKVPREARIVNPNYPIVAARADHLCEYCTAPEILSNMAFEVDHIRPTSRGGTEELDNLALACRVCNLRKYDHIEAIDPATQKSSRLFHPRQDNWSEHFAKPPMLPYQIVGKTPIGRVTVARLDMNSSLQSRAREFWVALNVFSLDD